MKNASTLQASARRSGCLTPMPFPVRQSFLPTWVIAVLLLLLTSNSRLLAQQQQNASPKAQRSIEEIQKDLSDTGNSLADVLPSVESLLENEKRNELAPKCVPLMRKMSALFGEFAAVVPEAKARSLDAQMEIRAMMALIGDKVADDQIAKFTVSQDETEAAEAQCWSMLIRWARLQKDPPAQEKLASEFGVLARGKPQNTMIAQVALYMSESAATPALAEQIERVVTDDLTSPVAREIGKTIGMQRKLHALVDKPLIIEGAALNGAKFSTAGWKGKVVLIDFWATWCPPCVAELPSLEKVYAEFHAKGLEVVGVSSDNETADLQAFLAKHPKAAWAQLFDKAKPGWNAVAEQCNVEKLPTVFLIDRKGIVRSVNAQSNYKELIPKLLEEKE